MACKEHVFFKLEYYLMVYNFYSYLAFLSGHVQCHSIH